MPPPPTPKRGLAPSLIDRLIDPESAGTAILIGYGVDQMYRAVLRDLEDLLNTRQTHLRELADRYPETCDSVLAFGLPDVILGVSLSADQRASIGRTIRKTIERFEPRLKDIKVALLDSDDVAAHKSLKFQVEARLNVDPSPDVTFETVLEMTSGKYVVNPAAA